MKIRKLTFALVVSALVSGSFATYASNQWIKTRLTDALVKQSNAYKTQDYLVASQPVRAGTVITPDALMVKTLVSEGIHDDAMSPTDGALVIGKTVKVDLSPNAPVLKSQISFVQDTGALTRIVEEERLVTIAVDALSSFNGLLKPEDRVDVLFSDQSRQHDQTVTLLTDVRVVATGYELNRTEGAQPSAFNTVSLACIPLACQKITHARNRGPLSLVLSRGQGQAGSYPGQTTTADLLGIKKQDPPKSVPRKLVQTVKVYGGGVPMNQSNKKSH